MWTDRNSYQLIMKNESDGNCAVVRVFASYCTAVAQHHTVGGTVASWLTRLTP